MSRNSVLLGFIFPIALYNALDESVMQRNRVLGFVLPIQGKIRLQR